jgi:trans-aconitate methyltransferase
MKLLKKTVSHCQKLIDFFFKYGILTKNFNTKEYWDDKLAKYSKNTWRTDHYEILIGLDLIPRNSTFTLIDCGCALGDGCILLKQHYPHGVISGCDFSSVGIESAKEKTKEIKFFEVDLLKDQLPCNYDYILILQTLEHFDKPFTIVDKLLENANEALIISVPLIKKRRKKALGVGEHRYNFDEKSFEKYDHEILSIADYVKGTEGPCIFVSLKKN